ncbi:hypothetical protein Tco_1022380 [Tanacetum coccineum]
MLPRFIQLFLNKELEGVTRPKNFLSSVTLPSKVFTFMRKHSPKFSCRITPLTPPMLEVITALAAEEEHSTSPHSRAASSARDAQGTPTQSVAQASISTAQDTAGTQGTAQAQDTEEVQDTDPAQDSQAQDQTQETVQIWVESQNLKKRRKKRKKQKKKVSSVKLGRNKEEGDLTTIWETPETSDDDFWKNQEDWEIIRWRLNDSSGVHTLELEDGTMIHMLAERRYPLSRELMIRMLDHGMEVEDESETAITLIHLFILWTTEDDDDEDVGVEADMNNLDAIMLVSPILTTRIHKDHPFEQIIGDLNLAPQTRRMTKNLEEHGLFSSV